LLKNYDFCILALEISLDPNETQVATIVHVSQCEFFYRSIQIYNENQTKVSLSFSRSNLKNVQYKSNEKQELGHST